jgi:hypothetical protein
VEVNEGKLIKWNVGKIYFRAQNQVSMGDSVVLFFCKTGENDPKTGTFQPGIYGWGTIKNPPQDSYAQIEYIAQPPSDYLKANILWDNDIERLTNQIRAKQYQGTMWPIEKEYLIELDKKIQKHIAQIK